MKALQKEQKKRWMWRLVVPAFLAAFFSVASSSGLSAKSISDELISCFMERAGHLSVKTHLPLLAYDPADTGQTFVQFAANEIDRLLPIYGFAHGKNIGQVSAQTAYLAGEGQNGGEDFLTRQLLEAENAEEREAIRQKKEELGLTKAGEGKTETTEKEAGSVSGKPVQTISLQKLQDFDYLIQNFYRVDSTTTTNSSQLNVDKLLSADMTLDTSGKAPQILIYHTHSQERFADSKDQNQSVVGLGDLLTDLLEEKGYKVLHHTGSYDIPDRDTAYSRAAPALEKLLEENPQIQVVIDLHRDGVAEQTRLVGEVNGKKTATIMFFNGLSHTTAQGDIGYLSNPNLDGNLAFSFQMQLAAAEYYPGFSRCIYLRGYRYNMHYRPKSLLVEVGAQTNTWEEVVNAMGPLADILDKVLSGEARESIVE